MATGNRRGAKFDLLDKITRSPHPKLTVTFKLRLVEELIIERQINLVR